MSLAARFVALLIALIGCRRFPAGVVAGICVEDPALRTKVQAARRRTGAGNPARTPRADPDQLALAALTGSLTLGMVANSTL
jgi:hypothetical protein